METLTCTRCGATWDRPTQRGPKPRLCPACANTHAFAFPTAHQCGERCAFIYAAIEDNWTLQAIGDELGITRERVRQLINAHGWTRSPLTRIRTRTCKICGLTYQGFRGYTEHCKNLFHQRATRQRWMQMSDERSNWERGNLIVALFDSGTTRLTEIAKIVGTQLPTVYRWLARADRDFYTRGPHERLSPQAATIRDQRIAEMWNMGVPPDVIMREHNVKDGNLSRIVKEQGAHRPKWYIDAHMARMRAMARQTHREPRSP